MTKRFPVMPIRPGRRAGLVARCPMLVDRCCVLLATTPLWLARVGLYQYLALEIMIWMLFALGYNLLLGYTGLPSFGHGAFFGIGAYAFGLLQQQRAGQPVVRPGRRRRWSPRCSARWSALFISHRRGIYYALLTIAFGQVFWFVADQVAQRDRRRGRPAQHQAPAAADLGFAAFDLASNEALFYFCVRRCSRVVVVALWRLVHSPFGRVLSAIKQNEMRAAFVGYNVWLYKWLAFTLSRRRSPGLAGALFAHGAAVGLPERDEPAQVGLRRDDGADRRRPGELLGAGDRRGCSSSSRATCSARTPRPGCSGTACCSWRWCCSSPRASPACGRHWRARKPRRAAAPVVAAAAKEA